jgi:lipopolysaccharide transport system ATP-binding protein
MSDIVIKVENLSKQYRLGTVGTGTLSHDLNRWWAKLRGKPDPYLKIGSENKISENGNTEYVWALRDISFEVKRGEVLGIIGKNGAGKSTLLKILSRITSPTTGELKLKGRVASLLEVGTGFHPELTGRENIFLNGSILGMSKAEIKAKFDEIVDFSGVERYIDTPVKRYSSGMYVRLAFAVAAHLDPEILIVDEVLAVGDAEFQKKCLGKMKDVAGEGRTVLFVSHNMDAVNSLCSKSICLAQGKIVAEGNTFNVVNEYLSINSKSNNIIDYRRKGMGEKVFITDIKLLPNVIEYGNNIKMLVKIKSNDTFENISFTVGIFKTNEVNVGVIFFNEYFCIKKGESKEFCLTIESNTLLAPDSYISAISVIQGSLLDGYKIMDSIFGYPKFKVIAPKQGNIMNWKKYWGNIIFNGSIISI